MFIGITVFSAFYTFFVKSYESALQARNDVLVSSSRFFKYHLDALFMNCRRRVDCKKVNLDMSVTTLDMYVLACVYLCYH